MVRQRHAEFEFEVGKNAQATYDDLGVDLAAEADGQTAVTDDLDFWIFDEGLAHQLNAFLGRKNEILHRFVENGDDHFIKQTGRPAGNIDVAVMDGIKRPWKNS